MIRLEVDSSEGLKAWGAGSPGGQLAEAPSNQSFAVVANLIIKKYFIVLLMLPFQHAQLQEYYKPSPYPSSPSLPTQYPPHPPFWKSLVQKEV